MNDLTQSNQSTQSTETTKAALDPVLVEIARRWKELGIPDLY